jgi:putative endonuclease
LGNSVTVARLTLDQLVQVRILVPQYFDSFALRFHKRLTRSVQVVRYEVLRRTRRSILSDRATARESKDAKIMWFVYIIECSDGRFYTGVTDNIEKRLEKHKSGQGGHFTKTFGVKRLLYREEFSVRRDAIKREAQLKGWTRKKKLALIRGDLVLLKKL